MDLWPFIPQRRFSESMEWLTDLIRCKGAEQRQALRPRPRETYQHSYILDAQAFSRAKLFSKFNAEKEFQVPLWGELTRLGLVPVGSAGVSFDTRFAHYKVGGSVVLWENDASYEVRVISALTADSVVFDAPTTGGYQDVYICPVRVVRFAQAFEATRAASDYVQASARFVATDTEDVAASGLYPLYLGHSVITDRSVIVSDVNERFDKEAEELGNGVGLLWQIAEKNYSYQTSVMGWRALNREALWYLRQWIHGVRGKWKGFWLPSWSNDVQLARVITPGDTTLRINKIGYTAFAGVRDLMLTTTAGDTHYLRVLEATPWSATQEDLVLSSATALSLGVGQVEMISFLTFARFDADRVEISFKDAREATISVPVIETTIP